MHKVNWQTAPNFSAQRAAKILAPCWFAVPVGGGAATKTTRQPAPLWVELDIPVQIVAPAFVQVVGRKGTPVQPKLVRRRHRRPGHRLHTAFMRQAVALAQVAAGAGGDDVAPGGPAAARARHDMVESQLRRRMGRRQY